MYQIGSEKGIFTESLDKGLNKYQIGSEKTLVKIQSYA